MSSTAAHADGHAGEVGHVVVRGTVVIDVDQCTGCALCIDACPPRVLVMTVHEVNTPGFRYPRLLAGCTGCQACAQICPDFVFQVYKYDTPRSIPLLDCDRADADTEFADAEYAGANIDRADIDRDRADEPHTEERS